jgi:hypothetical protein
MLQPPPLVLVHGIWSSAAQAWPGFQQYLSTPGNYPHNMIFPADYKPTNYKAYLDPSTQMSVGRTISDALACANVGWQSAMTPSCLSNGGVVARQVDVVAHSMGGLVTEYLIQNKPSFAPAWWPSPPSKPVHQLITIGTPYNGTPIASTLWYNQPATPPSGTVSTGRPLLAACLAWLAAHGIVTSTCNLGQLFSSIGYPVDTAVQYMLPPGDPSLPQSQPSNTGVSSAIVGQKPTFSATELIYNTALTIFSLGTEDGIMGSSHDTMVPADSQAPFSAQQPLTINGIVHTALSPTDTGETGSQCFWSQAAYWLMGGTGENPSLFEENCSIDPPTNPILDLTGYTQVPASNVTFSPASGSGLTINSSTNITGTSSTKTLTEILLFQTVSDPTDTFLLYSTQSPFSIAFTPTRMGATTFTAFAVFSDNTFAVTALNYAFQPSGSPVALNLVNAPVASLPVGSSAIAGAQALFSNGYVDVSQAATYKVRSGTTSVISVGSTDVVTANGPGVDWLDVSYGGLTASAQIMAGSCTYALSPTSQFVDVSGGSASVQVTTATGCAWTADEGGAAWLTAANASGTGGGTITLVATANTTGASQTAIITVAGQDVAITQPATSCTYTLDETQISAPATGVSGSISVTTSCPIVTSSSATWVSVTPLSSSVDYAVAANLSPSQRTATITVGTQVVAVTEAGAAVPVAGLTPASLSFGGQNVGSSSSASPVMLSNTGTASLTISSIAIAGTNSGDFAVATGTACSTSLAAGANCTINVTFTPTIIGSESASLSVSDNATGSPQTVPLTGTGVGPGVSVSSSSLTFAAQMSGTSSTAQTVTLTNTGNASLTFTAISASAPFAIASTGTTCTTSAPVTAGSTCTVAVRFAPTAGGSASGTLSFTDNATGSPQTVGLTGTGQDFTIAASSGSSTSATVAPGSPATYTLSVGGVSGFSGSVSFTCTGAPSEATCTVSPNPVTVGSSAANVTVSVTTTAPTVSAPRSRPLPPVPPLSPGLKTLWMLRLLLAAMAWALGRRNHLGVTRWRSMMVPLAAGLVLALALAGCGGGGGGGGGTTPNPGTPAGTYPLTITGTTGSGSSALSHSVTLTLIVS